MINLLYIIDDLRRGGPTIFVTTLTHLDKTKYNISVCCLFGGGELVPDVEKAGIKVFVLGLRKRKPWLVLKLVWLIRKNNVQIIHTHLWASNIIGGLSAVLAHVPKIITTLHHTTERRSRLELVTEKMLSYFTSKTIAVSKYVKSSFVSKAKINPSKIDVIYNNIDLEDFVANSTVSTKKEQMIGTTDDSFIIGTIANLSAIKGHRYLIKAIPLVLKEHPKVKFIFVGRGYLRDALEKQAKESGVYNSVLFLGVRNDIPELTSLFDLVVLPSLSEGLPSVLLEAMAMKKAIVSTQAGGIPEVVLDGVTGILVPPADSGSLTQAIIKLLKNKELRETMGQKGYERVKCHFSYPRMIKKLEAIYDKLIK